jgi:hypothetical protein
MNGRRDIARFLIYCSKSRSSFFIISILHDPYYYDQRFQTMKEVHPENFVKTVLGLYLRTHCWWGLFDA